MKKILILSIMVLALAGCSAKYSYDEQVKVFKDRGYTSEVIANTTKTKSTYDEKTDGVDGTIQITFNDQESNMDWLYIKFVDANGNGVSYSTFIEDNNATCMSAGKDADCNDAMAFIEATDAKFYEEIQFALQHFNVSADFAGGDVANLGFEN